ncbi:hypothetical protein GA0070607_4861 [Micromonospora coriariae]|uniref:Uncharacterized protein n=1 Tax=Micromonospora coriariae TaxID=285665 RepID=A0A1C4X8R8_9ACTN|nr:hypothetical protein [Micromonospora coriariae]SCF04879.1 hypothetical protein GA0070607_4861 [Micromonospora coriariae]
MTCRWTPLRNPPKLGSEPRSPFEHEIEAALAEELEADKRFSGDAALIVAAYRWLIS